MTALGHLTYCFELNSSVSRLPLIDAACMAIANGSEVSTKVGRDISWEIRRQRGPSMDGLAVLGEQLPRHLYCFLT